MGREIAKEQGFKTSGVHRTLLLCKQNFVFVGVLYSS